MFAEEVARQKLSMPKVRLCAPWCHECGKGYHEMCMSRHRRVHHAMAMASAMCPISMQAQGCRSCKWAMASALCSISLQAQDLATAVQVVQESLEALVNANVGIA